MPTKMIRAEILANQSGPNSFMARSRDIATNFLFAAIHAEFPDDLLCGEEHLAARELARVTKRGGLVVVRTSALDILRSRHADRVERPDQVDPDYALELLQRQRSIA